MAKNKLTLPPRKWYSLQQAADKLTREFNEPVTIDDLLHYYSIDLLELSIYIEKNESVIRLGDKTFSKINLYDEDGVIFPYSYLHFEFLSKHQEDINIEKILSITKGAQSEYQNNIIKIKISGFKNNENAICINGFMNLWSSINKPHKIKIIKDKGFLLNGLNFLVSPFYNDNSRTVIQFARDFECKEDIFITLDNIYILDSDLNDFLQGKRHEKNIGGIIEKNIPPRKEANQTEFIKALIKAHYGTDEPEKVRTLLGKNGDLAKLFARQGIELNITPETVRNWLKTEK